MAAKQIVVKGVNWASLASRVPKGEAGAFDELRLKFETSKGKLNSLPEKPKPIDWSSYEVSVRNKVLLEKFRNAHADIFVPYPEDSWSAEIAAARAEQLAKDAEARIKLEESLATAKSEIHKITSIKGYEAMTTRDYMEVNSEVHGEYLKNNSSRGFEKREFMKWIEICKGHLTVSSMLDRGFPVAFAVSWTLLKEKLADRQSWLGLLVTPAGPSIELGDVSLPEYLAKFPNDAEFQEGIKQNAAELTELTSNWRSHIAASDNEEIVKARNTEKDELNIFKEATYQEDPKTLEFTAARDALVAKEWELKFGLIDRETARGKILPMFWKWRQAYSKINLIGNIHFPVPEDVQYKEPKVITGVKSVYTVHTVLGDPTIMDNAEPSMM